MAGHETCQHDVYRLSCRDYEGMLTRAAGKCELCGKAQCKLVIDHDHDLGIAAVRGLVCRSCNTILGRVDNGGGAPSRLAAAVGSYLAMPITRGEMATVNVASGRGPGRPRLEREPHPVLAVRGPKMRWDNAKTAAQATGTNRTALINAFLAWFTREPGAELPERPEPEVED